MGAVRGVLADHAPALEQLPVQREGALALRAGRRSHHGGASAAATPPPALSARDEPARSLRRSLPRGAHLLRGSEPRGVRAPGPVLLLLRAAGRADHA